MLQKLKWRSVLTVCCCAAKSSSSWSSFSVVRHGATMSILAHAILLGPQANSHRERPRLSNGTRPASPKHNPPYYPIIIYPGWITYSHSVRSLKHHPSLHRCYCYPCLQPPWTLHYQRSQQAEQLEQEAPPDPRAQS